MADAAPTVDPVVDQVCTDLAAESGWLDGVVSRLDTAGWHTPTPSVGWVVRDQVAHLAATDRTSLTALTDPEQFARHLAGADFSGDEPALISAQNAAARELPASQLLEGWRAGRDELLAALRAAPAKAKVPWYGPPMRPASMATARLMETWAHGQDVADALVLPHPATDRLRHVARLAVATFGFAHAVHGEQAPHEPVEVTLTAPDGSLWQLGTPGADNRVVGSAEDFCLLATRRRHRSDTDVRGTGPVADHWLDVVQTFAGPPGRGRQPRA